MDLKSARAARGMGRYNEALALCDAASGDQRDAAAEARCRWLLELTISRRVINDIMGQLALADCPYLGFSHLGVDVLEKANATGMEHAFAALGESSRIAGPLAVAAVEEFSARGHSEVELRQRLNDLGCVTTAEVRFALAQTCSRETRVAAAIDHLKACIRHTPGMQQARRLLVLLLLANGEISAALTEAYFAIQLRRSGVGSPEGREGLLRYLGHEIFFVDGVFYAVPPTGDRRVNVTYSSGSFVELYNPIPKKWRRLYRGIVRTLAPGFVLRWLQRVVFRAAPVPVVFRSGDLFELTMAIHRQPSDEQKPTP